MEASWNSSVDRLRLPNEICYYIMQYLSPTDCMSLAISGVSHCFSDFYCDRRCWNFSRLHSTKPEVLRLFFSKYIRPSTVTSLDFSHCYWINVEVLLSCINRLTRLKELYVHDTQLNLPFAPLVFKNCPLITHFAVSFGPEVSWKQFSQVIEDIYSKDCVNIWSTFTQGFQQLILLKLYTHNSSIPESWLLILQVLGWCRDCTHLHLDFFYPDNSSEDYEEQDDECSVIGSCNLSAFQWMSSLNSLILTRSGRQNRLDRCFDDFCRLIFQTLRPQKLEHVWISPGSDWMLNTNQSDLFASARVLCLGQQVPLQLCDFKIKPDVVECLGGVTFASIGSQLLNLRHVQGFCSNDQDLDEFCRLHPNLEHLSFDSRNAPLSFSRHWALPKLKSLVYACNYPSRDILAKLLNCCPNLEQVHLGRLYRRNLMLSEGPVDPHALVQISRLTHLKVLTLSGLEFSDGAFFREIFASCPQLSTLHFYGEFDDGQMGSYQDLCKYLPLAQNLRDIRLDWDHGSCSESLLLEFLESARNCRRLERLVACLDGPMGCESHLTRLVSDFIRDLTNLVVLCLVCPAPSSRCVREIKSQIGRDIRPSRPWFWFHLGDRFPKEASVPRIHFDEIVRPCNYFQMPPRPEDGVPLTGH